MCSSDLSFATHVELSESPTSKFRPSRHKNDESDSGSDSLETNPLSTPRYNHL